MAERGAGIISSGSIHNNMGMADGGRQSAHHQHPGGGPLKKKKWEEQCEVCVPPDALTGDTGAEASDAEYYSAVIWTTVLGTLVNVFLTVIKLIAGIMYGSSARPPPTVYSTPPPPRVKPPPPPPPSPVCL